MRLRAKSGERLVESSREVALAEEERYRSARCRSAGGRHRGCDGDGGQSGGAGAAEKAKEDGWPGGAGMTGERCAFSPWARWAWKNALRASRRLLEDCWGWRDEAGLEWEFKCGGEGADEFAAGDGSFAAQVVIDVHDADGQVPAGGEFEEDV